MAKRDDRKIGRTEICQVMDVMPHRQPFPGDKNFDCIELLVKRRMQPKSATGTEVVLRQRVMCLQQDHERLSGHPWTPKIGNMVVLHWIYENTALVIGTLATIEQEPVCRPNSDSQNLDRVYKRSKWRQPIRAPGMLDFVEFPDPQYPDCWKWWHQSKDELWIWNCRLGHRNPHCNLCTSIDNHNIGMTWEKEIGPESTNLRDDMPHRRIFHHISGTTMFFDLNGMYSLENRVPTGFDEDGFVTGEDPRAHIFMFPEGAVEVQSHPSKGSRLYLGGVKKNLIVDYPNRRQISLAPGEVIIENLENRARIHIHQNGRIDMIRLQGRISLTQDGNIELSAPQISLNGQNINIVASNLTVSAENGSCTLIPPPEGG